MRNPPTSFSPSAHTGQCWPCSAPTRDPPGLPPLWEPHSTQGAGRMLTPTSPECQNLTFGIQFRVTNAHPLETCGTNPFLHKLQKNQTPPSPPQIPEFNLDLDTQAGGDACSSHCQWPMQIEVWLSKQMTSAPQFQFCNQKEPGFSSDFFQ